MPGAGETRRGAGPVAELLGQIFDLLDDLAGAVAVGAVLVRLPAGRSLRRNAEVAGQGPDDDLQRRALSVAD